MDETTLLTNIYINDLVLKIKENQETLNEILFSKNPSDTVRQLLQNLITALDNLLIKLNSISIKIEKEGMSEYIENDIKIYSSLIDSLHNLYEFLQFSDFQNVPYSILYFTNYLIYNFDKTMVFTIIPTHMNTFRFLEVGGSLRQLFRYSINNSYKIFPPDRKFPILMYPYAYNNLLSSNVLLAHEIGHFINLKNDYGNKLSKNILYNKDKIKEITCESIKRTIPEIKEPEKISNWDFVYQKTQTDVTKYLNNWFAELSCDLIALKLVGPSYIVSFIECILSGSKITQGSKIHPPPLLRFILIMKEFKESGYEEKLKNSGDPILIEFIEKVNKIYSIYERKKINVDEIRPELIDPDCMGEKMLYSYNIIENKQDSIKNEIRTLSSSFNIEYKAETLITELNVLITSIDNFIVPCEITLGKPANPISVINSGVIYNFILLNKLYQKNKSKIEIDESEFKFQVNKIIKKGLELCLIQQMCLPYLNN